MSQWKKWEDVREILDIADDLPMDDAMFLLAKAQTAFLASLVEDVAAIRKMIEDWLPNDEDTAA